MIEKKGTARRLARVAGLMLVLGGAGSAAAIDTLDHQAPQALKVTQAEPQVTAQAQRAQTAAQSAAEDRSDAVGTFQPYVLALAGALLMGYIGLRRPRE